MSILSVADPVFQQAMRVISNITNANPAVVTTTIPHQYQNEAIIRLNIPRGYGMSQANQLYAPIVVTGATTFTIGIDTTLFEPFIGQQNIGTTDGSGDASGTIASAPYLIGLGQTFTIGSQVYTVMAPSGALITTGTGAGTMALATGDYTFTGAAITSSIYWNPISFPYSYQYPQCTPVGELSDTLNNATQNVLPYSAT